MALKAPRCRMLVSQRAYLDPKASSSESDQKDRRTSTPAPAGRVTMCSSNSLETVSPGQFVERKKDISIGNAPGRFHRSPGSAQNNFVARPCFVRFLCPVGRSSSEKRPGFLVIGSQIVPFGSSITQDALCRLPSVIDEPQEPAIRMLAPQLRGGNRQRDRIEQTPGKGYVKRMS
jgi:hypothetical protein